MPAPTHVVVHPLVLLSVVDHYNRVAKGTRKRVVGVLLGEQDKQGRVDITNSYAVPFDEEEKSGIWFLDHNYHENMFHMFKKVNAKERVVGWYSTGPKIKANDLAIHEVIRQYAPSGHPAFVIVEVQPKELGIPTKAYVTVEEVSEDKTENRMAFQHTPSSIGALEAEEVGVEHLLRDVKDASVSNLATSVQEKVNSLRSLNEHIKEMEEYLTNVCDGKLPVNHQIINQIQDIFNLLPNLDVEELIRSFSVKSNDMMLVIYLSSVIRSVIALHNLINNKISNRDAELKATLEEEKEDLNEDNKEKQKEPEEKKKEKPEK